MIYYLTSSNGFIRLSCLVRLRRFRSFVVEMILKSYLMRGGKSTDNVRDQLDLNISVEVTTTNRQRRNHNSLSHFSFESSDHLDIEITGAASPLNAE